MTDIPKPRRARALLLCLLSVLVVSCAGPRGAGSTAAGPPSPRSLQIVAHQDDDVLFMNPDVAAGIRAGQPTVTVYLTAGEADMADRPTYAADRQAGSRAAYALMAGCADDWTGRALTVDADHQVELYTLRCRPQVQLVFVNIPEDADRQTYGGNRGLTRLWHDRTDMVRLRTLVPRGGLVTRSFSYDHTALDELLTDLLTYFRPTVVRAQDPDPDPRYTTNWQPYHDHPDHVMTARFAAEALAAYQRSASHPQVVALNYRDYGIVESPQNLDGPQWADKKAIFDAYARHDRMIATNPGIYQAWAGRMRYRWQRGTSWVARTPDGLLHAVVVRSGRVLVWDERSDGSWSEPVDVGYPGGPVTPEVAMVADGRGALQIFARRLDHPELITTAELPGSGWSGRWTAVGNPDDHVHQARRAQMGDPAVVLGGDGRLVLFVRNGGGEVSALAQTAPGGAWSSAWTDLGGTDVQDGLSAVSTADGRVELFAAGRDRVLHWYQERPGGAFTLDGSFPSAPPAETPTAVRGPDGRLAVYYPVPGTGQIAVNTQGVDERWTGPVLGSGLGGTGMLSAVASADGVRLFGRDAGAGVGTCGPLAWGAGCATPSDLGGEVLDGAVATVDNHGAVVVLAVGLDGGLLTDVSDGGDQQTFHGWQPVGGGPGLSR